MSRDQTMKNFNPIRGNTAHFPNLSETDWEPFEQIQWDKPDIRSGSRSRLHKPSCLQ